MELIGTDWLKELPVVVVAAAAAAVAVAVAAVDGDN